MTQDASQKRRATDVCLRHTAATMKSYRQYCGVAKALDVLGERWTLLIVRDLLLGPRRFTDLERSLQGITPNLLSKRLALLEQHQLVTRVVDARVARAYALTERGRSLEVVILGLGAFGAAYMSKPQPDERLDPRSAMLALKRRYRGSKTSGVVALNVGGDDFGVRFGGGQIDVHDGAPTNPDVTLSGSALDWFPLLSRRASLRDLEADGRLSRSGPARIAGAFVRSIGALP